MTVDSRQGVVVRLRPRVHLGVNRYFMCDHGRANYRWMNRGDRLEAPLVRGPDGRHRAVDWDEALARVKGLLDGATGRAVVLASPRASTEALYLARAVLDGFAWTGAYELLRGEEAPLAGVPNLALRAERAPNGTGADLLGYTADYSAALALAERAAVVLVLDAPKVALRPAGAATVYLGTVPPEDADTLRRADVLLPVANVAEEEGTFVNRDGRVQRYFQAKPAPGMAQPAWWSVHAAYFSRPWERGPEATSAASDAFATLARERHMPAFRQAPPTPGSGTRARGYRRRCRRDVLPDRVRNQDPRRVYGRDGWGGRPDAGRAADLRLDAGPARPQSRRAPRAPSAGGRRTQEPAQRGNPARDRGPRALHARARRGLHPRAPHDGGHPVRLAAAHWGVGPLVS